MLSRPFRYKLATWDCEMWHLKTLYQGPPGAYVVAALIQPKHKHVALALSNNTVELRTLEEGPCSEWKPISLDSYARCNSVFSADGRRLLTRTQSSVRLWDRNHWRSHWLALAHSPWPRPGVGDGRTQAPGDVDSVVRLWNVRSP